VALVRRPDRDAQVPPGLSSSPQDPARDPRLHRPRLGPRRIGPIAAWAKQARSAIDGRADPQAYYSAETEASLLLRAEPEFLLRPGISLHACTVANRLFSYAQDDEDGWEPLDDSAELAEAAVQADYIREIYGNPFRPVAVDESWRTPRVIGLAEAIESAGGFGILPLLGDALEEAGCTDPALLGHLRSRADHLKGCWALDLVLGKG
jgi:hypothetical protein